MNTGKNKVQVYEPLLGEAMFVATAMIILVGIFGSKWFITGSLWYASLGIFALIGFIVFALPVLNKQAVIVRGSRLTISSRLGLYFVCKIPDDLYQIIIKDGKPVSFVFKNKDSTVQVSPQGYKNGEELLAYFEKILRQGKVGAEIIYK